MEHLTKHLALARSSHESRVSSLFPFPFPSLLTWIVNSRTNPCVPPKSITLFQLDSTIYCLEYVGFFATISLYQLLLLNFDVSLSRTTPKVALDKKKNIYMPM